MAIPENGDGVKGGGATPATPEKRRSPGSWPDQEALREIVFRKAGIVSEVAAAIGMDRRTVYRRQAEDEQFRQMMVDARENRLDMSESVVFHHVAAKNLTAAIFHLKCQGKHRGWIERQEITGRDGEPLLGNLVEARKMAEGVRAALEDPEVRKRIAEMQAEIDARAIASVSRSEGVLEDGTVLKH